MTRRTQKRREDGGGGTIAPLYARLPRGPHQLPRGEVAENQRQRMHGAMVEAVAANGYGGTSVKQVVSLAGVSRRAFYEQFANKQDCFLTTIDLVERAAAAHIEEAYRSTEGGLEQRMRAALSCLAELANSNPKSAHLMLVDAPSAGAAGWTRLTRMLLTFERMMSASFTRTSDGVPLPFPVVRGIVGGLHRMVFVRLRDGRAHELPGLVDDMLAWTLATQTPAAADLWDKAPLTETAGPASIRRSPPIERTTHAEFGSEGQIDGALTTTTPTAEDVPRERRGSLGRNRARLLDSALQMAALEGCESLLPLRIVDHAGVSVDTFFSLFNDIDQCFEEALERLFEGVQAATSDGGLTSRAWPLATVRVLERLMRHFAAHPAHAYMIAMGGFGMSSPAIELNLLTRDVAGRLVGGTSQKNCDAKLRDGDARLSEGIAGAIWHTVYRHAALHKIEKLPAAAGPLAYVVLAPVIGAELAVEVVSARRARHRGSTPRSERPQRLAGRVGSAATL